MEVSLCRSLLSPELCLYFDDYLDQLDHISHLDHRGQVQHSAAAGVGEVQPVIPSYQQPWILTTCTYKYDERLVVERKYVENKKTKKNQANGKFVETIG